MSNKLAALHAARSRLANHQSFTTWCTLGVSPSAPPGPRRSSNDAAKARAAAQASKQHHLIRQACSALIFRMVGSPRARALAKCLMKDTVSSDHRPATSPANATYLALRPGRTNSGYVRSFCRLAATKTAPSTSAAPQCGDPSVCNDDTTVVSTANCAPPNTREAVHHNLQTAAIIHGNWEVEVAHKHVCGDSPSCLSTDARRSTLHGESPSSQNPPLERKMHDDGQSCQGDGHIGTNAKQEAKGDVIDGATTPETAGIRSWSVGLEGTADKLISAAGPLCARKKARALSMRTGLRTRSRCCHSIRAAASCCQPVRSEAGSTSSAFLRLGRTPTAKPA